MASSSRRPASRVAIRKMRERGKKVGFFRPFATEEVRRALGNCKAVCIIDRDYS